MHHCFQVYEILELVCEAILYQAKDENLNLGRPNLLALLKTCRSFNLPATKLLWRSLPNIVPLVLTMPENLVEIVRKPYNKALRNSPTVTFRRHPLPSEWERFDFYAPFVRRLGMTALIVSRVPTYMDVHDSICHELRKRDKILLPNLGTIAVGSDDNHSLAALFLGSQINCIELEMKHSQLPSFHQLITVDIPILAPSLKSLRLARPSRDVTWSLSEKAVLRTTLSTLLHSLDLEEFYCENLDLSDHMLETLVRMPRLRKLNIFMDIHSLVRVLQSLSLPVLKLKEFSLITDSGNFGPSDVAQVLFALRPSQLTAFHLATGVTIRSSIPTDISDLISAIGNNCSPKFLTHFDLYDFRGWSSQSPTIFDSQLLRPLFVFSKLQHLMLAAYPFNFTDAEVKELAISWPLLENLSFNPSVKTRSQTQTRTTLRCLLWFAIYCRNLQSLSFIFSGIDTFSDNELSLASNHKLSYLSVGYSTITQPDKVAAFFNTVFPSLWTFQYNAFLFDDETLEAWHQVKTRAPRQAS